MTTAANETLDTFAFMTAVSADAGISGGVLVVNRYGRPLEFHCTVPIAATRTQQILYGPTLFTSLLIDPIGPQLLQSIRSPVRVVLCEQLEALRLKHESQTPIAIVMSDKNEAAKGMINGCETNCTWHSSTDRFADGDSADRGNTGPLESWPLNPAVDPSRANVAGHERIPIAEMVSNGQRVIVTAAPHDDLEQLQRTLDGYTLAMPLSEPFERIREALFEALRHSAAIAAA